MSYLRWIVTLSVAAPFGVGCDGDGGSVTVPTGEVASVRITPPSASIPVEGTQQFTAAALDDNGVELLDRVFEWTSSAPAVATVENRQVNPVTVRGVGAGTATIVARTEGREGSAQLVVTEENRIQVTGRVIDGETGNGIAGAAVEFGSVTDRMVVIAAADGSFSFQQQPGTLGPTRTIDVVASAAGYVDAVLVADVSPPSTQLPPLPLVRASSSPGGIQGVVRNARNNQGIASAAVTLYRGVRSPFTDQGLEPVTSTTSDAAGNFGFTNLTAGTYSVSAAAQGFNSGNRTAISVGNNAVRDNQDVILSPEGANEIRIVLLWSTNPSDLDAHLTGPNADTSRFHIYFPPDTRGSLTAPPFALLDVDDTQSPGYETITITQLSSGTYRYSVHDFTNRASATSTALGSSDARVELYTPASSQPRTFFVPNQRGTLWTVFELSGDIRNPTVNVVNSMGLAEDPGVVPMVTPPEASAALRGTTDAEVIGRAVRAMSKPSAR